MKFIIIGRTATGKTALAHALADRGLKLLRTTTTRPQRGPEDVDYTFITDAQAAQIPNEDKVLKTSIAGYEYFTTMADLEAADVCILDPDGYQALTTLLPETSLHVVHATCADPVMQKTIAVDRAADPVAEQAVFNQRQMDENAVFSKFEQDLAAKTTFNQQTFILHPFVNDYKQETLDAVVDYLMSYFTMFRNVTAIASQCLALGHLTASPQSAQHKGEYVEVTYPGTPMRKASLPLEVFVDTTISAPENFTALLTAWLTHPMDVTVHELQQVADEVSDAADGTSTDSHDDPIADSVVQAIMDAGPDTVADFLGTPVPADEAPEVTVAHVRETFLQMPPEELSAFMGRHDPLRALAERYGIAVD